MLVPLVMKVTSYLMAFLHKTVEQVNMVMLLIGSVLTVNLNAPNVHPNILVPTAKLTTT